MSSLHFFMAWERRPFLGNRKSDKSPSISHQRMQHYKLIISLSQHAKHQTPIAYIYHISTQKYDVCCGLTEVCLMISAFQRKARKGCISQDMKYGVCCDINDRWLCSPESNCHYGTSNYEIYVSLVGLTSEPELFSLSSIVKRITANIKHLSSIC